MGKMFGNFISFLFGTSAAGLVETNGISTSTWFVENIYAEVNYKIAI